MLERGFEGGAVRNLGERRRIDGDPRESRRFLADLLDGLPGMVYRRANDGDWSVVYVSEGCCALTGYKPSELENGAPASYDDLIHPADRERFWREVEAAALEARRFRAEYRILTREGATKWVWEQGRGVTGGRGEIVALEGLVLDITARKSAEEDSLADAIRYREVLDSLDEVVFEMNERMGLTFANRRAFDFFGYTQDDIDRGFNVLEGLVAEDRQRAATQIHRVFLGEKIGVSEYRAKRKDGWTFPVLIHSSQILHDGQPIGVRGVIIDATERKQAQDVLKRYQILSDHARDIILFARHADGRILEANCAAVRAYGYRREEMLAMSMPDLVAPVEGEGAADYPGPGLNPGSSAGRGPDGADEGALFETAHRRKDGSSFPVEVSVESALIGEEYIAVNIIRDITERRQADEKLRYFGLHDALTGLHNRAHFEQEMRRLEEDGHSPVGMIICDVDGLKLMNDTLGHDKGDTLLVTVAKEIHKCVREGDVLARIGGDEFAMLLPGVDAGGVESVVQRIHSCVAGLGETHPELVFSISVGSSHGEAGADMGRLFKEADDSMYREKLHRSQSTRSAVVQALMKALEARNSITEGHAERLQDLTAELAAAVGLPESRVADLRLLAQFHDVGKVGMPDRILFKDVSLTDEEAAEMRRHCEIGHRIAQSSPDLAPIAEWILKHHEWWNGNGYPLGLKGEEIPLECRILAIADAYDTMSTDRPNRKAMSQERVVAELEKRAGTQFDPELTRKFVAFLRRDGKGSYS